MPIVTKWATPPKQPIKVIPNCPVCNGERELNGLGGFVCYFCGHQETKPKTAIQTEKSLA